MTDARWTDVLWSVDSATRHFREAVALFHEGQLGTGDRDARMREMALMHLMQSGYTSFENALLRILKLFDEEKPDGHDWHKQLVERCVRPIEGHRAAILPEELKPAARRLRGFRHWATHGYDDPFDRQEAELAIKAAERLSKELRPAIEAFIRQSDA